MLKQVVHIVTIGLSVINSILSNVENSGEFLGQMSEHIWEDSGTLLSSSYWFQTEDNSNQVVRGSIPMALSRHRRDRVNPRTYKVGKWWSVPAVYWGMFLPFLVSVSWASVLISSFFVLHRHRAFKPVCTSIGARLSVVGWGTMLQAGRSRDRVPMRSLDFFQFT
jgi:hypothetical protein